MDINTIDISPFSRNSSTFDPRSSKQTQEFLGENRSSSTNHFKRRHTHVLTTLNVSFEEEVRIGEGLLTLGIVLGIRRAKRKKQEGKSVRKYRYRLQRKSFQEDAIVRFSTEPLNPVYTGKRRKEAKKRRKCCKRYIRIE
ncbi:uncharacterized protein LOC122575851 [Bombus pyrosoma]|uniref:uncharacterized protein LOC122575851 n=1 Tax=Bombus pyrosoma TaxID=396416 RepID=UPI001CB8FEDA|nr:uncharacterized protein LOC122575851 [Bombus pyrosoma]